MEKILEVVIQYCDLISKNFHESKNLSYDILSIGQTYNAIEYIDVFKLLFRFLRKTQMIKQFKNGDDVCSIYNLIMDGHIRFRNFSSIGFK